MIVITDITSVEVDRDDYYEHLMHQYLPEKGIPYKDSSAKKVFITEEHIDGKKIHAYGQEFVIAISSDAGRKLGAFMKAVSDLEIRLDSATSRLNETKNDLHLTDTKLSELEQKYNHQKLYIKEFKSASAWKRFKYLLTGTF